MKSRYIVIFFLVCSGWLLHAQSDKPLIPVFENNLWGFINQEGKMVIKPRFHSIGDFSEGIAPARENELFGYVNNLGKFVVNPKYDFALPFQNGLGKVYIKGKPFFINTSGEVLFEHNFIEITHFQNRQVSFALAQNEKYALISLEGETLIEPTFHDVGTFNDGLALVKMLSDDEQDIFFGVINEIGEFVVDFGEYDRIEDFKDGYARVWKFGASFSDKDIEGVIDMSGELVFTVSDNWSIAYPREDIIDGVGIVNVEIELPNDDWTAKSHKKGLINEKGELIFESVDIEEITYFNNDRAFIRETDNKWSIINKKGEVIKADLPGGPLENKTESDYASLPFQNGIEILQSEQNLILINTEGKQLSVKTFGRRVLEMRRRRDMLFYLEDVQSKEGHYVERWGFWNLRTGKMTHAKFERIIGFTPSGFIHVVKDGEECVVDKEGHIVWIQRVKNGKNLPLNVDYMLDGYIYAMSPHKKGLEGFGGFSEKGSLPNRVDSKQKFPADQLSIVVKPKEKGQFNFNVSSIKAYVVNTTQDTAYFDVEDSRMEMILEAKDSDGVWRSIEFLPRTFCGNSYHMIYLAPDYHWSFDLPEYAGAFQTKLRAKLVYRKDYRMRESLVIYSNEFDGSINPAQFWRQKGRIDNMPEQEF